MTTVGILCSCFSFLVTVMVIVRHSLSAIKHSREVSDLRYDKTGAENLADHRRTSILDLQRRLKHAEGLNILRFNEIQDLNKRVNGETYFVKKALRDLANVEECVKEVREELGFADA